jgi:hypothetical protein
LILPLFAPSASTFYQHWVTEWNLFKVLFPSSGVRAGSSFRHLLDEFRHQERLIPAASPVAGQLIQIFPPGASDR